MADDPVNQRKFAEDVATLADASSDGSFTAATDNIEMPSVDEVWKMIEQMDGISDAEKAELKENLYNSNPKSVHTSAEYTIFFVMIGLVMLLFALFGYKLYKSLKEKELKKQEKLKSKQAKKLKKTN